MYIGFLHALLMLAGFMLMFCSADQWGHYQDGLAGITFSVGLLCSMFGCVGIWAHK